MQGGKRQGKSELISFPSFPQILVFLLSPLCPHHLCLFSALRTIKQQLLQLPSDIKKFLRSSGILHRLKIVR
jgi:hypothetical protein